MFWFLGFAVLLKTACAIYPSSSDVIDLNESNFDRLVTNGDEIWVVEFYAPWCGHCQQLVPEYSKAATALKGVVKVGGVDCDKHRGLAARFGVSGFPTIKIFEGKGKPTDYNGARQARSIVDAALDAAKSKVFAQLGGKRSGGGDGKKTKGNPADVVELTDSNFDKLVLNSEDVWLVEFYAPWCGHCKSLAPEWADAATQLKGKVKLGALDATQHQLKASEYGVRGYPTIKFFPGGKKDSSSVEDYAGGRTASDIVNFALEKHSENVPAPEIVQVTSAAVIKSSCEEQPLCIVAVLPHILDCQSECRNKYIKMLTSLGEKFKKKLWGWVWSEAGSQLDLEAALDIGGFGYPALAVLNAKKMKYSILRGSFSESGISEFLRDLSFGRGTTAPVKGAKLPEVNKIEPWDGKDGELPQEEEIDLSDVELDDIKQDL